MDIAGIIFASVMVVFWVFVLFCMPARARAKRRRELLESHFPQEWERILQKNVPFAHKLPESLKKQFHGIIQVLMAEKRFVGCGGLDITDEIRVTILGQAAILLLNQPDTHYFKKLKTIYVYPHTYEASTRSFDGVMEIEGKSVRLGESWQNGPIVLAWDSVTGGARNMKDGRNVVFHEFAHQLDQEDGVADGAPILESRSCYRSWARVLGEEYENLHKKMGRRRKTVIRYYGGTNPAEFFAVATEAFFEKPKQMNRRCPDLYEEMKHYYKVDPLEW